MNNDFRVNFLFENLAVRGEIVRLEETVQAALDRHHYPAPLQALVGEALAAAALLTGTLKFDGLLVLQARGEGPLKLLMAECSHDGNMRAIARYEDAMPDAPLVHLLGADQGGYLAITIEPNAQEDPPGQRYQGIVPLDGLSLAECIEHYFSQSEQLTTRLWLVTGEGRAAGLLLQEMPDTASAAPDADGWSRLCRLTDTLTAPELLGLSAQELLHRLYNQEDVRLFSADSLRFACSCTAERVLNALRSLGTAELRSIIAEQGRIEVTCEFCNQARTFHAGDFPDMELGSQ